MYLAGHLDDRTTQTNLSVVKISSGGTVQWSRKHPIGGIGQTEHMDEGPMLIARNGNLYVVAREGQLVNPPNGYIAKLFRINTSTGSLIVTEPRAKLPITPPRAEIVIVPRPLCTDSVPSLALWSRAAEAAGRASAASMAKVRSALITSQYRQFNCVLHHWNVRRL
jgi:hypothetical protein